MSYIITRRNYWAGATGGYTHSYYGPSVWFPTEMPVSEYGVSKSDIREFNPNPSWRIDVANRRDAGRPYERSGWNEFIPIRYRFRYSYTSSGIYQINGLASGGSPWDPSAALLHSGHDDALRDIALSRLKRKLADQTRHMNILVPMAEIGEMRGLITSAAKLSLETLVSIQRVLRRPLRRGSYVSLGKQIERMYKDVAGLWLQYSFAIKPTLSDISSAVDAVNNILTEPERTVVLTGNAKSMWRSSVTFNSAALFSSQFYLRNVASVTHELRYHYTAGFKINLLAANSYNTKQILDQFGVGLGSLPSTGWELVPFSWVIDYFSTVGAYLDDVFTSPSHQTFFCSMSRLYTAGIDRQAEVMVDYPPSSISGSKVVGGLYNFFDFQRTIHAQLPHRSLRFKTADEIGKNAVNRLLNLAAVFVSGHKPPRG